MSNVWHSPLSDIQTIYTVGDVLLCKLLISYVRINVSVIRCIVKLLHPKTPEFNLRKGSK